MAEREIRVPTPDGGMLTFIAHPDDGGPFPVAILFMDGVGYRDQIKANARRFAEDGYFVVAPDLYYRAGDGLHFDMSKLVSEGADSPERQKLREAASSVKPEKAQADVEAALAAIAGDPAAAAGVLVCVGYCMGARLALAAAARFGDRLVAAAGIHPGNLVTDQPDSPHHDLQGVRAELYYAFAEIDQSATPELVDRFRDEMALQGVRGTVERLPGAAHGFAMEDLPVYQREAAERHFERTLDLWRRNLQSQAIGSTSSP